MPRTSANTRLHTLFDQSQRPIYAVDSRRRIIYCNTALAEWLDLEPARIVGRAVEYHTETLGKPELPQVDSPLADLCPPPRALAGEPCQGTISSMGRDGRLAHRHADFIPLGPSTRQTKVRNEDGSTTESHHAVLVLLSPADLSPHEIASDLSVEPTADELHRAIRQFRRGQTAAYSITSLLGDSSAMRKVRAQVTAAADSRANVLIYGPRGSGRGHVARAIHYHAGGEAGPALIAIKCDLLTEDLLRRALESLRNTGVEKRHCPTLLLENVEHLAPPHQAQLLAIIRKSAMPLRIISTIGPPSRRGHVGSADARSEELVSAGSRHLPPTTLDPGLLDAVSTIRIDLPRLVERLEDLPILAQSLLEACNVGSAKQVGSIRSEALNLLALHRWPGELDELREVIAAAHRATTTHEITPADLPAVVHHASQAAARTRRRPERIVLDDFLAQIEKEVIGRALAQAGGNKTEAAELLGMTRPRLYRRMVQLGLVSEVPTGVEPEQPEFFEQDPADHAP